MSGEARDTGERIAAALESIAASLAIGVARSRAPRQPAGKGRKQVRPPAPPARPRDELAQRRAAAELRKIGL